MDADPDPVPVVVSASQGPVRSLPAKIQRMLSDPELELCEDEKKPEVCLLNNLKNCLQQLIDGYLLEPSEIQFPALTAKYWVEEIRELSYDIDDFLDELVNAIAAHKRLRGRIARFRERRSRSRWAAKEMARLLARLEEAVQRYRSYNLDKHTTMKLKLAGKGVQAPPLLPLREVEAAAGRLLVGVESTLAKLEGWLGAEDQGERHGRPRPRVVSIVGSAGVGKTALANELYRRLGTKFDCRAFVRSSRKPNIRKLLSSILLQVGQRRHLETSDRPCNLTKAIRAHLQDKAYLIIVDDLWDASTWDIIHHALPDDNLSSAIITTTELEIVAHRCCGHNSGHIFKMEPLSNVEASKLFSSIFHRSQPSIQRSLIDDSYEELSIKDKIQSDIVRKCGGFPLVTIATANLLAKEQEMEQWHCLWSSLSSSLELNPNIEGIKQVLCLCYDNLPEYLKTCMLYCSLYPEDEIIQKDDLVNLWMTEGFICVKDRKDIKEVAYNYFDELVGRGMIQPARVKRNGEVLSCTVHYLILELIQYKSIEENFVTTVHHSENNIRIADKVHRLSLHFGEAGDAKPPEMLRLSQIRSLFFFGLIKSLPTPAEFRHLRSLILHLWGDQDNISLDLNTFSKLYGLRHFTIACNVTLNLQGQLQGVQYLDTLKIEARVTEVPQDIVHLPRLLHLSLPGDRILPGEIGRMVSLETLGCYDLSSNSAESVLSLGKLTNLQDLHLTCSTTPCNNLEEKVGCLATSLSGLCNLKCLTILPAAGSCNVIRLEGIASSTETSYDSLSIVSSPPALLEKLELSPKVCIFSRLPSWISELDKLAILKISALKLSQRDIDILRKLNSLASLSLYVRTTPAERILFDEKGFSVLRDFKFICPALCPAFVKGAIPKVRTLKLGFCAKTLQECSPLDAGLEHLKACAVFSAKIGYAGADEYARKFVHSALEDIFGNGGSHPVINVHLVNKILSVHGESSTMAQEELPHTPPEMDVGSIFGGKSSTETTNTQDNSWITPPQDPSLQICSSCAVDMQNPEPKAGNKPQLMESAMLSISTGAMNSILMKLGSLKLHLNEELRSKGEEGLTLEYELQAMNGLLKKFSNTPDPDVMKFRNQMMELTYDIEDSIDNLVTNFVDENGRGSLEKMVMPYDFIDQIRKLRARVKDAELQSMFPNIEMHTFGQSYVPREYWLSRINDHGNGLVGMEGQRDKLVRKMIYGMQNELQWVCIVGDAGIGKTTLAKQVYNEIKGRFSTSVFISVPKKLYSYNNVGLMLSCLYAAILAKLRGTNIGDTNSDVVISEVKRLLHAKRFLMVIDGVSSDEVVYNINLAVPQNSTGSGIIITTCSGDVVELVGTYSSSFVHPMMPLTFKESLCLFGSTIFGSVRSCPVGLEKDFEEIVKACRGIPLAIRVIAGALSSKPAQMQPQMSKYAKIIEGIGHQNAEWIEEILGIGYSDLSSDMKTCLLYLCSFPENHVVKMDRLVRRWVSEGFVTQKTEETLWEAGKGYFVELISRKLIEPVYDEEDVLPSGCTISGSVYDFITSQSSEENFIKSDVLNELHNGSDNHMKSLALVQGTLGSKVRSLTFVCDYIGTAMMMPYLSAFRHLRVLDLGDTKGMEIKEPKTIGSLSLLRYLGLGGTDVTRLPEEITALQHLSTLDLRRTRVTHVPAFTGKNMISLLGDQLILEIGRGHLDGMQKLEELAQVLVGPDGSAAEYMAKLVNQIVRLKTLGVRFSHLFDDENLMRRNCNELKQFLEEMLKSKLQSLMLDNYRESLLDILFETWANKMPPYLRKFELRIRGCLLVDPEKMASLIALTHLNIEVTEAEAQGISALGMLPKLVLLNLYVDTTTTRLTVSSSDGFQCLKVFRYRCRCGSGMGLQFGAGAMPQLQRLWLDFNVQETMSKYGDFCFGIQHLSRLVQVCATIDCKDTLTAPQVEEAEADIRAQVSQNPNNPVLKLNRRGHDHLTQQQGQFFIVEAPKDSVIEIHGNEEWISLIEQANSSNKLVLIQFTASWCGPSRRIAPFFSYLARTNPSVVFLKLDVDEMEDICMLFNIEAVPTFLFLTGGDVKDEVRGADTEELLEKLNKFQKTQIS